MDEIGRFAEQMGIAMMPLVAMLKAEITPVKDDLTKHAAKQDFGVTWVEEHIRRGNIVFHKKNGRMVCSRASLELLKASERMRKDKVVTKMEVNSKDMPVVVADA